MVGINGNKKLNTFQKCRNLMIFPIIKNIMCSASVGCGSQWQSEVLEEKKVWRGFEYIFHAYLMTGTKSIKEIEILRWLLVGRANMCQHMLPDGQEWPSCLGGTRVTLEFKLLKFLWSSHQVGMENVSKAIKTFFAISMPQILTVYREFLITNLG